MSSSMDQKNPSWLSKRVREDQPRALTLHEHVGFRLKRNRLLGSANDPNSGARSLTVVSAADPDGVELPLEPNSHPAAAAYQGSIFRDGIPATSFATDDLRTEIERLRHVGVRIVAEPSESFGVIQAAIDDTVGKIIGLNQIQTA